MSTENQEQNKPPARPPHRFQPGQSGNPGGRPKGRSMTSRLREIVDREIKDGKDYGDLIMEVLVKAAAKGNIKAISMLMDRVDGKVVQQLQVETTNKAYDVSNTPDSL